MSNEANAHHSTDLMELWKNWNGTTIRMWSSILGNGMEAYRDPFGLYNFWMKSTGIVQEPLKTRPPRVVDPVEVWNQWADATVDAWRRVTEARKDAVDLFAQWVRVLEVTRGKILRGEFNTSDTLMFFKQCYDSTNETWKWMVGEAMHSERLIEANSQFIEDSCTNAVRFSHLVNERILQNLQIPTRSDIAQVARLIISLEEKVHTIEDAFVNFEESYSFMGFEESYLKEAAHKVVARLDRVEDKLDTLDTLSSILERTEIIGDLAGRLEQVEGKLNRLLGALENIEAKAHPESIGVSDGGEAHHKTQ